MNYRVMWHGAGPYQTIVGYIRSLLVYHPDDPVRLRTDALDNKPAITRSDLMVSPNLAMRDVADPEAKARAWLRLIYSALYAIATSLVRYVEQPTAKPGARVLESEWTP